MQNLWKSINLNGIKAVLIDLDNTIYKYEDCHKYALRSCFLELKKNNKKLKFEDFENNYKIAQQTVKEKLFNHGSGHSRLLYFKVFFENFYGKTQIKLSEKFESIYWKNFFKKIILVPGVMSFLKKCYKINIKICIVSDLTTQVQFKKISYLKLEKYIDFVVTSEEAGSEKPSPDIFILALKKLKLSKEDVLMIGDHYKKDIEGAKSFGIRNVYQISHNY